MAYGLAGWPLPQVRHRGAHCHELPQVGGCLVACRIGQPWASPLLEAVLGHVTHGAALEASALFQGRTPRLRGRPSGRRTLVNPRGSCSAGVRSTPLTSSWWSARAPGTSTNPPPTSRGVHAAAARGDVLGCCCRRRWRAHPAAARWGVDRGAGGACALPAASQRCAASVPGTIVTPGKELGRHVRHCRHNGELHT